MEEEDEVQGRGLRLPPGLGGTTHPGPPCPPVWVFALSPLPLVRFSGVPLATQTPVAETIGLGRARNLARTLAGLICLHSLNVLEWAAL